ncbi:hypothetical protein LJ725_10890 [Reyranella aquatilis]|uniref:N-acetyltransferase domain-containing protein n=1 Tax=Reyranella aquatilis TaxID=2035356 RepID=A0ABS8KTR3_9HYPH|nr:hypothetical protein [Reyranella aquatilis]MCC8429475.1 hypothetical protein [Reyranella aquatilis]
MADIEVRTASHDDIDFITRLSPPGDERLASQARLTVERASTAGNSAILIAVNGDGRRRGYAHLYPETDDSGEEPRHYVVQIAMAYQAERSVSSVLLEEASAWLNKHRHRLATIEVLTEDESGAVIEAGTINPPRPS